MSQVPNTNTNSAAMSHIDPKIPLEQQYPPPPAYQQHAGAQSAAPTTATGYADEKAQVPPPQGQHPLGAVDNSVAPQQPPRPQQSTYVETAPAQPPRPGQTQAYGAGAQPAPGRASFGDDIDSPVHYTRDPHRLVGYLVPFPKANIPGIDPATIPARFLIYTPPPPPLQAPAEGEKESKSHKLQRKWQNEVRTAKQSDAKLASWKGLKSRATKGISFLMGQVVSADLEFLNRVPGQDKTDKHAEDGKEGTDHKTVGLEALDMVYPPSLAQGMAGGETELRTEFIESMMRTKSKAQKDAVLATGLLPVSLAMDVMLTLIWPFGGLLEIDSVWAYSSIRGAKTSRSVTKRLASSTNSDVADTHHESKEQLRLNFLPSQRLEILRQYLAAKCAEKDPKLFHRETGVPPTEATVLEAIGWSPSQTGGEAHNWEDEQWETTEVKDDLQMVMKKAAGGWDKWCKNFEKNPEKALKK